MLGIVLSAAIGLATGAVQFFLLRKFVTTVTGGKTGYKTLLFAMTQFLFPFAVLVICAFLLPEYLLWTGIGIAVALISSAVVRFVLVSKKS